MKDKFDGYTINLFLDEEGDWMAHFLEMPNISAFGSTPGKAIKELEVAWEVTKESYKKHGEEIPIAPLKKNYSGQFNVRIDKRVHRELAVEAARAGVSLNALVAQKLGQSVKKVYGKLGRS